MTVAIRQDNHLRIAVDALEAGNRSARERMAISVS